MGVELYISRAELPHANDKNQITAQEWLELVASDSELDILNASAPYSAVWSGKSKYETPWLEWCDGNIETTWPDTALYIKMLHVASKLNAKVKDADGYVFNHVGDWEFDPNQTRSQPKKEFDWFKFILIFSFVGGVLRIILKELKVF